MFFAGAMNHALVAERAGCDERAAALHCYVSDGFVRGVRYDCLCSRFAAGRTMIEFANGIHSSKEEKRYQAALVGNRIVLNAGRAVPGWNSLVLHKSSCVSISGETKGKHRNGRLIVFADREEMKKHLAAIKKSLPNKKTRLKECRMCWGHV